VGWEAVRVSMVEMGAVRSGMSMQTGGAGWVVAQSEGVHGGDGHHEVSNAWDTIG